MRRVAVVGASGFVGRAVAEALARRGADVVAVRAPRLLRTTASAAVRELVDACGECEVVVNCAGQSDATASDEAQLKAANAELAGAVAAAAATLGARLVHVSSAAVQGHRPVLDSSEETAAFSSYSRSKVAGERAVHAAHPTAVVYRPPGVHDPGRSVTRSIATVARSPLASVGGDGSAPTAQAQLPNVADAVAFLALTDLTPPTVVHHPSEGLTTAGLLRDLGGREPRHLPVLLTRGAVAAANAVGRVWGPAAGQARRADILWHGQAQAPSWLTATGWEPPVGRDGWVRMGQLLRDERGRRRTRQGDR